MLPESQNLEIILLIIQFLFVTAASMSKTQNEKGKPTKWGIILIAGSLIALTINIALSIQKNNEELYKKAKQQEIQHLNDSSQISMQSKILDSLTVSLRQSSQMLSKSVRMQDSISYSIQQSETILNQSKEIQQLTKESLIQQRELLANTDRVLNPIFPLTVQITLSFKFELLPSPTSSLKQNFAVSHFVTEFLDENYNNRNDSVWQKYTETWPGGGSLVRTNISLKNDHPYFKKFDSLLHSVGLMYFIDFCSGDYQQYDPEYYYLYSEVSCYANAKRFYTSNNPIPGCWRSINIDLRMQRLNVTVNYPNLFPSDLDSTSKIKGINDLKGNFITIHTGNPVKWRDTKDLDYSIQYVTFFTGSALNAKKQLHYSKHRVVTNSNGERYFLYPW